MRHRVVVVLELRYRLRGSERPVGGPRRQQLVVLVCRRSETTVVVELPITLDRVDLEVGPAGKV
jgi:hypothetical protein